MSDINETYPALDSLASKLGLILSRIQETIFKDFLNSLDENGETWDDFKNSHGDPNFDIVKKYINSIIQKIGYDISGFSKDSEVFKLFVSIIDTSNSVADTLGKIFKENGSGDESLGDGAFAKDESFSEFFSLSGKSSGLKFGNNSFGGSVEFDNSQPLLRLKAIYDSVQKLLQLFKYLSEIEWKNIAESNDEFYKFVKKNHFSEKFAKRLVDYVLITFIKTAREVFENDIERIIELSDENSLSKLKSYSSLDDVEFNNALDNVREYKRQIDTINELITSSNANVFSKEQLEIFKNVLRQRIDEVLDGIAPEYNATAKVLNRIYAVFEFLGFIGYDKVDLAQFASNATDSIEVKIPVFRWDLVEKAFANLDATEKKYFDIAFPMENKEDFENLISRISNLARSFQKDIPQFDTVKQVLWNQIARVNLLINGTIGIVDEEINKLITLKKFLLDLLKTNEIIAIQTKNSLTDFLKIIKILQKVDSRNYIMI